MLGRFGRVLALVTATWSLLVGRAVGHGYMETPAARNVQHNSDWCPQCLNAGGTDAVWGGGDKARYGVCGDVWNGRKHHEAGGKYASPPKIAARYARGKTITVRVVLTANHVGRWSVRLCPLSNPAPAAEKRQLTDQCLQPLRRADGSGPYTYVPADQSTFQVKYRLPPGVTCKRCVLQWLYETGYTCRPGEDTPRQYAGINVATCGKGAVGEIFVNCADIAIAA
jgi:hypothetical protein